MNEQIKKTRPDVKTIKSAKWTLPCTDDSAIAIFPNGDLLVRIYFILKCYYATSNIRFPDMQRSSPRKEKTKAQR